jgi:hypothetical protein
VSTYVVTFLKDFPPYAVGEQAAFGATKAVELFCNPIASLSSGDQATLAAQIAAYQMQDAAQSPPVNPDTVGTQP